jgi:hypothetical protein
MYSFVESTPFPQVLKFAEFNCFDRGTPPEVDFSPECGTWRCEELRGYFLFFFLPTYRV